MEFYENTTFNKIGDILKGKDFSSDKIYHLGKLGNLEVVKNKSSKILYGFVCDENKEGLYLFNGENLLEFEKDVVKVLKENNQIELALRIKENGLEKTSKYYQNLQSKSSEVGK